MAKLDMLDVMRLSSGAMRGHPLRSTLSALGIAIGVAAVIMLTSLAPSPMARVRAIGFFKKKIINNCYLFAD